MKRHIINTLATAIISTTAVFGSVNTAWAAEYDDGRAASPFAQYENNGNNLLAFTDPVANMDMTGRGDTKATNTTTTAPNTTGTNTINTPAATPATTGTDTTNVPTADTTNTAPANTTEPRTTRTTTEGASDINYQNNTNIRGNYQNNTNQNGNPADTNTYPVNRNNATDYGTQVNHPNNQDYYNTNQTNYRNNMNDYQYQNAHPNNSSYTGGNTQSQNNIIPHNLNSLNHSSALDLNSDTYIVKDGESLWLVMGHVKAKLDVLVYVDPNNMQSDNQNYTNYNQGYSNQNQNYDNRSYNYNDNYSHDEMNNKNSIPIIGR